MIEKSFLTGRIPRITWGFIRGLIPACLPSPGSLQGPSVVIGNSAVGMGGRWDTFQSRLRERRTEVIGARGRGFFAGVGAGNRLL
jgi:hypothetical protein